MSWMTWVLIVSSVSMNASAQLLMKAATRPLAHVADFGMDSLLYSVSILCRSAFFWGGMLCYAASICVWLAALPRRR